MKTWKLLLAAMMALVMLFAVTALAEETPTEPGPGPACTEEDHAALEWVTVKEPTCAEAGSETRKCEYCGFTETREIPATGHTYTTWTIVTKPTCTQPGVEETVCDICNGAKQTREVEATGHAWVPDEEFPAIEVTCTEDGRAAQYYCPYCWTVQGGETIPATGHTVTTWEVVTKPTCTQPGLDKGVCDVCGEEVTREVEATGHAWVLDEEFPAKEATCTEDGRTEQYYCPYCWAVQGGEVIPATGHTVTTWVVVTKPTCTQPGLDKGICDVCGEEVTCEVEPTGHAWVLDEEFPAIEPTCTEEGRAEQYYCPYCWAVTGGETIPATGHSWGKWVTIKEATEDEAGLQERTCSVCGATETREIGTMPETGVATVPTAALVSLMVLAMGSYVVLKKKESC